MRYPIAIEPGDDTHAWGGVAPDLPGCFSAGDTLDEAIVNASEAITLWIEAVLDDGATSRNLAAFPRIGRIRNSPAGFGLWRRWIRPFWKIRPSG
jgi:predicted RNase H-like HicB family nuclease